MKAVSRAATAALAAGALALALLGGISSRAVAAPQATPMPTPVPTPMATPVPSPMPPPVPNPAVTPAGNPVPTAPSPGTDMLNNNPNGGSWLDKFNRRPTPEPGMRAPMRSMRPAWCKTLMKPGVKLTAAQRAKLKSQCM